MFWVSYVLTVLIVVVAASFFLYFFQERFLFLPGKKLVEDFQYSFPEKFQEINLKTKDGETLNALHFQLENPKGIILFFHGNKGNLSRWGTIVPYLLDYNYEVFVMDYRGYGKSTGKFYEAHMYNDAQLAYDFVKTKFTEDQIVVYGRSLGGTFAAKVASENSPKHVILEAPFYNIKRAAKFYFSLSPTFMLSYQFPSDTLVTKISSSTTFFHGDKDKTTSFEDSKKLFELVGAKTKEFVAISDGTHHNVKDFKIYQHKLEQILD